MVGRLRWNVGIGFSPPLGVICKLLEVTNVKPPNNRAASGKDIPDSLINRSAVSERTRRILPRRLPCFVQHPPQEVPGIFRPPLTFSRDFRNDNTIINPIRQGYPCRLLFLDNRGHTVLSSSNF